LLALKIISMIAETYRDAKTGEQASATVTHA